MYECHITIDPVFEQKLLDAKALAESNGFKVATLIMRKSDGTEVISQDDTFMTGHGKDLYDLKFRMKLLAGALTSMGYGVRRCKIEDIIFDTKYGDTL